MKTVLIANRGEIAVRIIQSLREMGLRSVAVYSDVDKHALHVQLADYAWPLGGQTSQESYLNVAKLLDVARASGADAIHPGYGFLSENAAFAQACDEAGLIFIGPKARVIAAMGDKIAAKALAEEADVPTVPGWRGDSTQVKDTEWPTLAKAVGYPLLVKASAGGGGKGMRRIDAEADLVEGIHAAQREAEKAFGNPSVFLEKYLTATRHVEVQLLADHHGTVVHVFERDCSTQRRHQKILEEAPAPLLPDSVRESMTQAAIRLAKAVGYENAGTVEFMLDSDHQFYFLEMNTRLQVEHPVTEWITGLDLVREQIRIARGEALGWTQADLTLNGHAIEARLYAEDPSQNFMPATGTIDALSIPNIPFCRMDIGVREGDSVTIFYDPMIAKISAWAPTRQAAIDKLIQALKQLTLVGVTTNRSYLIEKLQSKRFQNGDIDTHWLNTDSETQNAVDSDDASASIAAALATTQPLQAQAVAGRAIAHTQTMPSAWVTFN